MTCVMLRVVQVPEIEVGENGGNEARGHDVMNIQVDVNCISTLIGDIPKLRRKRDLYMPEACSACLQWFIL